jgi:hypothetical protein
MLQVFYLDVAYVLQWLFMRFQVLLQVFQAHVAMPPMVVGQRSAAGLWLLPRVVRLTLSFRLPPLPSLPSISPQRWRWHWGRGCPGCCVRT